MVREALSERYRLKMYLRENWGAPFVVSFMLLLLVCAGLLVSGKIGNF